MSKYIEKSMLTLTRYETSKFSKRDTKAFFLSLYSLPSLSKKIDFILFNK